MSSFEEDVKKHPYKNLTPSFESISDFTQTFRSTIIISTNEPINGCEIELNKDATKHHFSFVIQLKSLVPWKKFSFEHFGFNNKLEFKGKEKSLFASDKSVISITQGVKDHETLHGELAELDSAKIYSNQCGFFRIIVPTEREAQTTIIDGTSYTDKKKIYGFGLVKVVIDGIPYHIYRYSQRKNKEYFLIVESLQKVDFETFSTDTDSIIKALSLLTGNWFGDQRYILLADNSSFDPISSIHFRTSRYSIVTGHQIIDPHGFVEYMNALGNKNVKNSTSVFPEPVFSRISTMLKHSNELERSLFLILEGNQSRSPISRITSYLVALETLASSISSNYKDNFKTIKSSEFAGKVKKELINVLQNFENELPKQEYAAMLKKLEHINSPSNMDKILKSFEIFGIKLSPKMKKIIKTRNLFLHGKTPFEEKEVKDKYSELAIDSLRMHSLVSILFLKFCGYSGHLKNLAGWKIYEANRNNPDFVLTEEIFYTI